MSDITIRVATPDDAAALLDLYAPYVRETAISFETVVPSEDEFRRRIIHTLQRYPYLIAEAGGHILGYAYTSPFVGRAAYDWCAETSIYVDMKNRHSGVGRALYEAIERVSRAQHIQSLCACIGVPDGADDDYLTRNSIDFHAHMGYRMVANFSVAAINLAAGTTWPGWKSTLATIRSIPSPSSPFRSCATACKYVIYDVRTSITTERGISQRFVV